MEFVGDWAGGCLGLAGVVGVRCVDALEGCFVFGHFWGVVGVDGIGGLF